MTTKTFYLFLLLPTLLFGQKTNHFNHLDSKWNLATTYTAGNQQNPNFVATTTTIYGYQGDTLINNEQWFKLYATTDSSFQKNFVYQGLTRSANDRILYLNENYKLDTLYDFNLNIGDSVLFNLYGSYPEKIPVTAIDSIQLNGEYYKRFKFAEPILNAFDELNEVWIEGIGSIHGPLFPNFPRKFSQESPDSMLLTCTYSDNQQVWKNSSYPKCYIRLVQDLEWSPIAASWYYDVTYALSKDINYHKVYCDAIVNVKGIDCKRINIDYGACNNHFAQKLYTYDNNGTIYFYNADIDTFQVLYNFNAIKGDVWEINTKSYYNKSIDTVLVQVDSVGTVEMYGHTLKKLYVTYNYLSYYETGITYQVNSVIIQLFGDIGFLINILDENFGRCDMDFIHSLRCYEDNEFGLYNTGIRDSCDYTYILSTIQLNQATNNPVVFPNPAENRIRILIHSNDELNYELFNLSGVILKKGHETDVDLSAISDGVYFLRLTINKSQSKMIKIIKHLP